MGRDLGKLGVREGEPLESQCLVDLSQYHHMQRAAIGGEDVVRKMGEKSGMKQLFWMCSTDKLSFFPLRSCVRGSSNRRQKAHQKIEEA